MEHKLLAFIIPLILLASPPLIAYTSEPETITPLADTYVDVQAVNSTFGERDYLEVSEYASGFSIVALMFDISDVLKVPSEAKLRLYCFNVTSPHVVGVHWCVNNTWNEGNLTFRLLGKFYRTNPEDAVRVDSIDVWYEWKVTDFIRNAIEENQEKITLTLEVEDPLGGMARSRFASKDQQWHEYSPQLVFTYSEPGSNSPHIIITALGLMVTVAIVFLAYRFLKNPKQKTIHHKKRARSK